jgi:hypothetical protein
VRAGRGGFQGWAAAAIAIVALAARDARADGVRRRGDLAAAARCVSEYLEAVAAAAPPRARPRRVAAAEEAGRWERARARLAPAALAAAGPDAAAPLAPWKEFARGGAFLGYELLAARRAPNGAAVVVTRERVAASLADDATERRCAYVVAPIDGAWRIASARCELLPRSP